MAGKLVVDTIDTDNAFITLNVQQSLIATMNVSGIYSNTGVKMIGANGTVSNTAITGNIISSQITSVANTQITGNIISSQITSNPTLYGNVSVTGVIGVGGATTSTSGSGISFPATQSASSDANTLDDYEEGTWTPTFTSSTVTFSYGTQVGAYTKIGNVVFVMFRISLNALPTGTLTNAISVSGLPFTASSSGNYGSTHAGNYFNWNKTSTDEEPVLQTIPSQTYVEIRLVGDNLAEAGFTPAQLNSNAEIRSKFFYFI
jgi:hypothetical protein